MEHLKRLSTSPGVSWYEIEGGEPSPVKRYIISTPETRAVCNRPELLGVGYTRALERAMTAALATAPFRPAIEAHTESRVCVLTFLRGGLNFDLRNALHDACGLATHSSAFMSSQRYMLDGRWIVREDMYRKLRVPPGAMILTGDVVATGVTVEHGLEVVLEQVKAIGSSLRGLIFFTIGCERLEQLLAGFDRKFKDAFPGPDGYAGSAAVYLEGRFRLVARSDELRIGLPGTDLVRRGCLLAPEFEASQLESAAYPLERCTIYDAGSRAFDIPCYVEDVVGYWRQVAELAEGGFTLAEALEERLPGGDYASREAFTERRAALWQGVPRDEIERLHDLHLARWTPEFSARARTAAALSALCRERIATLEALVRPRDPQRRDAT
jgi:hypothetical protein